MTTKPHFHGHRERIREKFKANGAESFQDYELLELLLSYAIPRKDVKPIAKKILKHFGSIAAVIDADTKKLQEIDGIGERASTLIKLVKDFNYIYFAATMKDKDYLTEPIAVVEFARARLGSEANESFMAIYLDSKNCVQSYDIIQEGIVNKAAVFPRQVMEYALNNKASGIILIHNHPSGDCKPSTDDKKITKAIIQAGATLEVRVLDHLIVSKNDYFSFQENGLI